MGTKAHPKNTLAQMFAAKTRQPGRYADGNGLYPIIEPSGLRRWEQRILIRGKRRTLGLGGYPLVSLAAAREKALENRRLARAGHDARATRHTVTGTPLRRCDGSRIRTPKIWMAFRPPRGAMDLQPEPIRHTATRTRTGRGATGVCTDYRPSTPLPCTAGGTNMAVDSARLVASSHHSCAKLELKTIPDILGRQVWSLET